MGKGRRLGIVVVALIGFGSNGGVAAEDSSPPYLQGASRKLGRGLLNVATAPLEFIREPYLISQRDGGPAGVTIGVVQGLVSAVIRELAGLVEVATFFLPVPKDFRPLVQPEFVYAHGDWTPSP